MELINEKSRILLNIVLLFVFLILFGATQGLAKMTTAELNAKVAEITSGMANCKDNDCFQKMQKQITDLMNSYYGSQNPESPKLPKPSEIINSQGNSDIAKRAGKKIKVKKGSPCYWMSLQNAIEEIRSGVVNKGFKCRPANVKLIWNVKESWIHSKAPKDTFEWQLEDNLNGSLLINANDPNNSLTIQAPAIKVANPSFSKLIFARAKFWDLRTIYTSDYQVDWASEDVIDFAIDTPDDNPAANFVAHKKTKNSLPQGQILSAHVGRIIDGEKIFYDGQGEVDINVNFTYKELKKALKGTKVEKVFKIKKNEIDSDRRHIVSGSVKVEIRADEPGNLKVSPKENFKTSRRYENESFSPTKKIFSLSNTGGSSIKYNVANKEKWLTISNPSGTIQPQKSKQVTLIINQKVAKKKKDGTYKDVVIFNNETNDIGSTTRDAILENSEEQIWEIRLKGFIWDDNDGAFFTVVKNAVGKKGEYLADFGQKFMYDLVGNFVIKKEKGRWKYKSGVVKKVKITTKPMHDLTVYKDILDACYNCKKMESQVVGSSIGGSLIGRSMVKLNWPEQLSNVRGVVDSKLNLKTINKFESHKGISSNLFNTNRFIELANTHRLPLKNTSKGPIKIYPDSLVNKFKKRHKLSVRQNMNYQYTLRRLK